MGEGYTVHVGSEDCYLALYTQQTAAYLASQFLKGQPLNHVAIVVDDLGAIEAKVNAAGLEPFSHSNYDPGGKAFYFFDFDGIEFEIVSYP